jgi:hypothetical protein
MRRRKKEDQVPASALIFTVCFEDVRISLVANGFNAILSARLLARVKAIDSEFRQGHAKSLSGGLFAWLVLN